MLMHDLCMLASVDAGCYRTTFLSFRCCRLSRYSVPESLDTSQLADKGTREDKGSFGSGRPSFALFNDILYNYLAIHVSSHMSHL